MKFFAYVFIELLFYLARFPPFRFIKKIWENEVNRLYNVISSYEVIGFFLVFRRINEGNSIKNIYSTSLVRGNKRLYLTSGIKEVL